MSTETKSLHKEGCPWDNFYHIESLIDHNGPDFTLTISEDAFSKTDMHKDNSENMYIPFSYCPCCGVNLSGVEDDE